jgi:hypothetical protein
MHYTIYPAQCERMYLLISADYENYIPKMIFTYAICGAALKTSLLSTGK